MLNKLKTETQVASSGKEALELLQSDVFDLVFMDVTLPDLSGVDVTKQFRATQSQDQHVPILALTAHAHSDDKEVCLAAGMDDFLVKPLLPDDLRKALFKYSSNEFGA